MRVVGVRLPDRSVVWADALDVEVSLLDRVVVKTHGCEVEGDVFVAPGQLVRDVDEVGGVLVSVQTRMSADHGCRDLPGADLPPLGGSARTALDEGMIVGIDAVRRSATLETVEGERREVSVEDLLG